MAAATVAAATVAARAAAAGLFAAAVRSPAAHRPPARSTTALAPASRRGRLTAAECHKNAPTPAGIGRRRAAGGASSSPPRGAVCELVPHATVVASRPWPCRARWWARRCVGQGCRRRVRRRSAGKRGSLGRLVAARRLGELPQVGQRAAMQPVAGLREPPKVAARAGARYKVHFTRQVAACGASAGWRGACGRHGYEPRGLAVENECAARRKPMSDSCNRHARSSRLPPAGRRRRPSAPRAGAQRATLFGTHLNPRDRQS